MAWKYALIGLLVGSIIGAIVMRFSNRKLRQYQTLQSELKKSKAKLDEYRKELTCHFTRSAELLDILIDDYRQLYQYMAKSSNTLLPDQQYKDNPFRYNMIKEEQKQDQIPCEMQQPQDYPESTSRLVRTTCDSRK